MSATLQRARTRYLAAAISFFLGLGVYLAPPAHAFLFLQVAPDMPDTTVGQTFPAALGIQNTSTPPQSTTFPILTVRNIDFYPSCTVSAQDCSGGTIETGVYDLSPTGVGMGPASCTGTWTITEASPGRWRYVPPGGEGTLQLATGELCVVNFTGKTLRVPTTDVAPGAPGVQTSHVTGANADAPGLPPPPPRFGFNDVSTVAQAVPPLSTQASSTPAQTTPPAPPAPIPATTTDIATLGQPPSGVGAPPTGTITFNLFGPADPTCAGPAVFTNTVPVNNGFTAYPASAAAPITAPGTYRWVATYSGDANYAGATTACGDPLETVTFGQAAPTITTVATQAAAPGQPITDTATLSGGFNPTGTITFTLFGPNNATCTGAPIFTSTVPVAGNGTYTSGPFTPTTSGSYNWIAGYSGDTNNAARTTVCGEAGETSTVGMAQPTITTNATPTANVGQPITDTATLANGVAPTGTITFTLFGPNNAACTGAPIFTSTVPVAGNGTYTSGPFTPTAPGTYNWIARYNGDTNNSPAATLCGDPGETSTVSRLNPGITTTATPTATVGQPITDTAALAGGNNPTGTITFTLFDNPTCTGAAIFTSTVPVAGNGNYTSGPFTTTAPGSYNWIAAYSGDGANNPAATLCGDPGETTTVSRAQPTIVTAATPTANVGQPITDTATLSGGVAPTGTITFTLFGPDNATCSGAAIFTATTAVNGAGNYTSAPFTPTAPGTYRWIAAYSGDTNNNATATACNDPGEASVVARAQPAIVTAATQNATVGSPINDTATLSNGVNPTGTITFTLFGPNNATCTGAPIFTSTVPVNGNGNYTSGPFTPTAPGSYNWIGSYSGDANNGAVATACGDPGETTPVQVTQPIITTVASGPVTLTQPISDTATLTGGLSPTGTITFTLFGPANPTCTGAPIFTSTVPVNNGNGNYVSGQFTPTAAGSYQWVAVYSGDASNGPATSACGAPNETSVVTVLPTIMVDKTANPLSRPEPGGDYTFTVVVTNTSSESLTITSLNDDIYGNLATRPNSTCNTAIGTVLAPGGTYQCQFTGAFTGNAGASQTDVVTVTATNPAGVTVTDTDDATVTITNVPPTVDVQKTASPLSRPEPGGDFTYTVVVTNTSAEAVTITSLTDDVYGNLVTRPGSTCNTALGTVLQPNATYTCQFTAPFTGNAGASQTDIVTVTVIDDDNSTATDTDDATVTITDVQPVISVQKTANPLTRPEPGGDFTFTVVVTNNSIEPVRITGLTDNVYGNLNGRGTCATGAVLAANGGTYTCSFTGAFNGNAGATQTDVVTATAVDDDGDTATATDDATVSILNVNPQIIVEKDATPTSRPEPGGTFTFSVRVTNNSQEPVRITALTDNIYGNLNGRGTCATGAVLQPGQSYTCSFTGNFTGPGGASQTDTVTATAVDDEGNPVSDTDDATVTITNVPPTVAVQKTASPLSRPEPGGDFTYTVVVTNTSAEPVTITSLNDNVYGNLTTRPNSTCTNAIGTVLQPGASYTCQFTAPFTADAGASLTDVVTVIVVDDENTTATATDDATVTITNVLPTIRVQKSASPVSRPEPGGSFTFSVVVTNTSNEPVRITSIVDNIYGDLNGRGTCAIGATLPPGGTYSCSFTAVFTGDAGATQTDVVTVTAVDNEGSTATDTSTATVTLTNVAPTIRVEKSADPLSRPEPGGTFTFSVVVTNTSNEAVTITALTDDVYGNLNGRGTCSIGAVLQPGQSYRCQFTGSFIGDGGQRQTDTVTATAIDNENTPVSATDNATVTIIDIPPTIAVRKTASPTSQVAPGGTFTFTLSVTNTSSEPVQITSLVDNIYGNLNGRGTCAVGAVLAPNQTYTCQFSGDFVGNPGASQTDTITVIARDNEGNQVIASAQATVTLTGVTVVPPQPQQPLPRTGNDVRGPAQLAGGLVVLGLLMVGGTWRSQHSLAFVNVAAPTKPHRRRRRGLPDTTASAFWGNVEGSSAPAWTPRALASGLGLGVDRRRPVPPVTPPGARAGMTVFGVPIGRTPAPEARTPSFLRRLRRALHGRR